VGAEEFFPFLALLTFYSNAFTYNVYRFVAKSTGHQISSRLLSMRSANALLELPPANVTIPAGTLVPALLIENLSGTLFLFLYELFVLL
jgi:hypothetical protein